MVRGVLARGTAGTAADAVLANSYAVMRGLVPRIHVFAAAKAWMAGPSQAKPGHDEFNVIGNML